VDFIAPKKKKKKKKGNAPFINIKKGTRRAIFINFFLKKRGLGILLHKKKKKKKMGNGSLYE